MGELGTPRILHHNGTDYPVALITGRVKEQFEARFVARAHERLATQRKQGALTQKEYLGELRELARREDRGEFAFLSEAALTTMVTTHWGMKTVYSLLLPQGAPLDDLLDQRWEDLVWLLQRIISESMPATLAKAKAKDEGGKEALPLPVGAP